MAATNRCAHCHQGEPRVWCSHCSLVPYCSEDHMKQNLPEHKRSCDVVTQLTTNLNEDVARICQSLQCDPTRIFEQSLNDQLPDEKERAIRDAIKGPCMRRAYILSYWDSKPALEACLEDLRQVKKTRVMAHGVANPRVMCISACTQLRLGRNEDFMQTMLELHEFEADEVELRVFDVSDGRIGRGSDHVGFLFLVMVAKLIAFQNLEDLENLRLANIPLPLDLVLMCQEKGLNTFSRSIRAIRKHITEATSFKPVITKLDTQTKRLTRTIMWSNPYFLPAFFLPDALRSPPQPSDFWTECSQWSLEMLVHIAAQRSFWDVNRAATFLRDGYRDIHRHIILSGTRDELLLRLREHMQNLNGMPLGVIKVQSTVP